MTRKLFIDAIIRLEKDGAWPRCGVLRDTRLIYDRLVGKMSYKELAIKYNISDGLVKCICYSAKVIEALHPPNVEVHRAGEEKP